VEEYAARWILRCDRGENIPEQHAQFERWLAADAAHRAAYRRLEKAWRQSEGLKAWNPHDGSLSGRVLGETLAPRAASTRRLAWAAVAAFIALSAAFFMNLWSGSEPGGRVTYVTETGGYRRALLSDGSVMQLNTDSRTVVHLTAERREVRLERGEAYFEIAPDARRPFEVLAGDTRVRAVGTAFSVRLRNPGEVEVLVAQGRVAVGSTADVSIGASAIGASESTMIRALVAGETAISSADGLAVSHLPPEEISRRLAWQSGQLVFQGETLDVVVAAFSRYHHRRIEIADPSLASLQVGGSFAVTDLDSFIVAMTNALPVRIEHTPDAVRIFSRESYR
jgi:transmembrane sensor